MKYFTIDEIKDNKNFDKDKDVIVVNNDIPITFTNTDYEVEEGVPYYADAEENGRSGFATAVISRNTLAIYTSKDIEYPEPKNWTKAISKAGIYNKSHIIGYSLSAKRANKNNIFIGTSYLNQITMKSVENEIYEDVKKNNRKYIYKVSPIYKFKEDVVPIAILIEAETIDRYSKKTLCRCCYNIQEGIRINYYDGGQQPIEVSYGKREEEQEKRKFNTNEENNKYKEYTINVRTKVFHLYRKQCKSLKSVEPKYIQETKGAEKEIKNKGFKLCKKCNMP